MSQPPYNLDKIEQLASGDPSFVKEMVTLFYHTVPDLLLRLEVALGKNDLDEVVLAAHKLISPLETIQASSLVLLAREIENRGRRNGVDEPVGTSFPELKSTLGGILNDLKTRFNLS